MKKLAVLISDSGTGSNLKAIYNAIYEKKLRAQIVCVISNSDQALGYIFATEKNFQTEVCNKKEDLINILGKYNPNYICLCGWKHIITNDVLDKYKNRILNIHPGLIPDSINRVVLNPDKTKALWNRGKLTDKAINEFLKNKSTYAGSSLHFLSNEFDFGTVLGRCFEKIKPSDTIESLYTRLKKKENKLYVNALISICNK